MMFGHIIKEIRCIRSILQSCNFQHVKREGKKLARSLTKRTNLSTDIDVWVEELLSDFDNVFQFDIVK